MAAGLTGQASGVAAQPEPPLTSTCPLDASLHPSVCVARPDTLRTATHHGAAKLVYGAVHLLHCDGRYQRIRLLLLHIYCAMYFIACYILVVLVS